MVNTIIAKTNGKDKVIDFRDCLNLANKDDYAMMHGIGGKEHARTSVIKLTICDYTAGKGELSKTVSANISPATCEKLFEVCKRNIGTLVVDDNVAPLVEQRSHNKKQNKIADMQFEVLQHVLKLTKAIYKAANQKQMPGVEVIANSLISMLSQTKDHVLAQEEDPPRPGPRLKFRATVTSTMFRTGFMPAKPERMGMPQSSGSRLPIIPTGRTANRACIPGWSRW